jgi:hypothetical protein
MVTSTLRRIAPAFGVAVLSVLLTVRPASAEVEIGSAEGWTLSVDGRFNTFISQGFGDAYPNDPADGSYNITGGSGLGTLKQTRSDGTYQGTRIRSGFLGNIFAFNVKKQVSETTTARAYMAFWSTVETNLVRYDAFKPLTAPDVREGYLKLEGPWGSVLAGRSLGLYSRGSVEINFNYGHNYGLGFPCNIDEQGPTCGMIGFGVLFPFFASGILYTTPSLGGLTLALGEYDPVILAGHWERVTYPRTEAEIAYQRKLGTNGMVKLFSSGIWQRLGLVSHPGDTNPNANKTVDVLGGAGGLRFEMGPLRFGAAGHIGRGVGFYYAIENSPAAYYFSPNGSSDPNDGNLRTFSGYYGQTMLVLGKFDLALGYGVSQLHKLSYDTDMTKDLPHSQRGINVGIYYHIRDYLVYGLDVFDALFKWDRGEKQHVDFINTGLTMTF